MMLHGMMSLPSPWEASAMLLAPSYLSSWSLLTFQSCHRLTMPHLCVLSPSAKTSFPGIFSNPCVSARIVKSSPLPFPSGPYHLEFSPTFPCVVLFCVACCHSLKLCHMFVCLWSVSMDTASVKVDGLWLAEETITSNCQSSKDSLAAPWSKLFQYLTRA